MFSSAVVLFLGYGLREEYVLRALQESVARPRLFGTGPHFIVTPEERSYLPETVRHVRYLAETKDHRDAIHVLEVIADFTPSPAIHTSDKNSVSTDRGKSIYFIADLIPYGKWTTSQTLRIEAPTGNFEQMIVGEGYVDNEVAIDYGVARSLARAFG
jgi:hypothetical protein